MVQFFATLALIASDAVADDDWALTLVSAAIETTAKLARTIKIRRIRTSNWPRLPGPAATRHSKMNGMRGTERPAVYPRHLLTRRKAQSRWPVPEDRSPCSRAWHSGSDTGDSCPPRA